LEEEKVCVIRIKEQVGEKRSTVSTHGYVDCLLKNTSTKHNKYDVNQKHVHVDESVSENILVESVFSFSFQNKICPKVWTLFIVIKIYHTSNRVNAKIQWDIEVWA